MDTFYSLILSVAFFSIVLIYLGCLLIERKMYFALLVFMFAIPLKHVYMTLGGHYLELWKVLSLLALPITIKFLFKYFFLILPLRLLTGYFFLALFVMILGSFTVEWTPKLPSIGFSPQTIATQLLQLLAFLNLALIPLALAYNNPTSLKKGILVFIFTMVALALLGLAQYSIYQFIGINIFPIPRMDGNLQEEVLLNYMSGDYTGGLFRITSLSMEPKNLALYLVTGIIFLLELKRSSIYVLGHIGDAVALTLMGLCLLFTYSTLGFVMVFAYFILNRKKIISFGVTLFIVLIPLMFIDVGNQAIDIINDRVFNRIGSSGFLEDFDQGAWDFFYNNPLFILTGLGLGNMHIVATAYLPDFAQWASGNRWHAKMGWLYILSATGIGGILLISASFFSGLNCVKMSQNHRLKLFLHKTLLFFSLFYFLRQNEFVFLILGFALAAYVQVRHVRVKPTSLPTSR